MLKIIFSLFVFLFISPSIAFATTYYVSPTGNDSNVGTSESAPWKTLKKATASVAPGDQVYVHGGTYAETVVFTKSGTANARITFSASPNETPVIDGSSMTSTPYDGLVQVRDGVNYLTFDGFTIRNSPSMGLANRGSNNIFSNNKILLSYDTAIWHRFGTNTVFRNNEVYLNVRMNATAVSNTTLTCNGAATGWPAAMNSQNSTGALWEGNTVHNNCGEGVVAHLGDRIIGNTFRDNWSVNIYFDSASGVLVDRNFVYDTDTTFSVWPGNGRNIPVGIAIADELEPCATFGNTISNNIIVNNRFGISFYPYVGCSGIIDTKIINNSFINSWEYGIRIQGSTAKNARSTIANNLFYSTRGKSLTIENPADFQIQNNLWYLTSNSQAGQFQLGTAVLDLAGASKLLPLQFTANSWGNPEFAGTLPSDPNLATPTAFALKNTSPAINAGSNTAGSGTDFTGVARPFGAISDIGAYEFTGTAAVAAPTAAPTTSPWSTLTSDFTAWITNYRKAVTGYNNGDFNSNGVVDGVDYMLWVNHYAN